jgi:hypothetical protein
MLLTMPIVALDGKSSVLVVIRGYPTPSSGAGATVLLDDPQLPRIDDPIFPLGL